MTIEGHTYPSGDGRPHGVDKRIDDWLARAAAHSCGTRKAVSRDECMHRRQHLGDRPRGSMLSGLESITPRSRSTVLKIDDCLALARCPSELGDCGSTMRSREHFVALDCVRRLDRIVRSSGDPPARLGAHASPGGTTARTAATVSAAAGSARRAMPKRRGSCRASRVLRQTFLRQLLGCLAGKA